MANKPAVVQNKGILEVIIVKSKWYNRVKPK